MLFKKIYKHTSPNLFNNSDENDKLSKTRKSMHQIDKKGVHSFYIK